MDIEINKLSKVHDFEVLAMEVMPDHVHLLYQPIPDTHQVN